MLAHVKQVSDEWIEHSLEEHLREVARISSYFASSFKSRDWANLAGLWHDLGKYRPSFQSYIRKVSGYDPEAHIEGGPGRVDHSTAGAIHAMDRMGDLGRILAYLIAGHHAGLPDWASGEEGGGSALSVRIEEGRRKNFLAEAVANSAPIDILNSALPSARPLGGAAGLHLWIRMLFSCLVDADFLDTEKFMAPLKSDFRQNIITMTALQTEFDKFMRAKSSAAVKSFVNEVRQTVLQDCRSASQLPQGIFTLSVPTGGGKTLSGMAFALEHAVKHNLKRVIVVIPYTSIIEQTAAQYRDIFAKSFPDAVLEHHSNLDVENEDSKNRIAAENWDAPIVVTTNVQLLESLFAAKTSRCRKLHNIVNSVIVFDEAQLLPPNFLQPVLDTLNLLKTHYGVTIVLSTATQPALSSRKNSFGKTILRGIDDATEIIKNVHDLYRSLNRVCVHKPADLKVKTSWTDLAAQITQHTSVLVIVNTRLDCRTLFSSMPKGTIHLSASLCGKHRSEVIQKIKKMLNTGLPVRVVSTQLVEAGVDIDFPVVYRALAGLDSIAQAAGRCNREGKLGKGDVFVFVPPKVSPPGAMRFAEQATRSVWHDFDGEPLSSQLFEQYFELYFGAGNLDTHNICGLLYENAQTGAIQFRTAAKEFSLIDEQGTIQILVPFDGVSSRLIEGLRNGDLSRGVLRKLQRYCVSIYDHEFKKLRTSGAITEIQPGRWAVDVTNGYDNEHLGLMTADSLYSTDASECVF